jgi:hypothetical protein
MEIEGKSCMSSKYLKMSTKKKTSQGMPDEQIKALS